MNIADSEVAQLIIARTCGCNELGRRKVTYNFADPYHALCLDKKDIILAQLEACETLLKYASDDPDKKVVEKEIAELRMAMDLLT
ncbi:hypothetical protein NTE_01685 [Candidatus Nitrososphaera evergladensis SR1]|jgi:hypothetical protein|uniref:Uncharacterized protein n=1 Tax=Candidatus Nitrososphaera evergladensis SR1 TaxID=1459636 RepID=A0A075MQD8_9ARCH|nr:hypothetical protein [Candidatus Nitrososphaera evergladensis]AIF83746.1 hypothetical protein NTE_01685 [Candidatus Nitrososphaera evergladensis SR1]